MLPPGQAFQNHPGLVFVPESHALLVLVQQPFVALDGFFGCDRALNGLGQHQAHLDEVERGRQDVGDHIFAHESRLGARYQPFLLRTREDHENQQHQQKEAAQAQQGTFDRFQHHAPLGLINSDFMYPALQTKTDIKSSFSTA
ncbi:MAG: hypothetical protein ACK5O3_04045 [Burkholderiales bacterium]